MATVTEVLNLLFTMKDVGVYVKEGDGYAPLHERFFDDSEVLSIKIREGGDVFINAEYTKETVAPITASEDDMARTHY